jgi:glucose-1-phosphate adenylyltransferase
MRNVLAMILAGGKGDNLLALSRVRATASVPFAGHYRLIDFALSNCTHSGITNVGVLTQYLPASLKAHIGIGKPWDLDRRDGGVRLLEPYYRGGELRWYRGTGDALAQNVEVIDDRRFDHVVVTAGDHVYKIDYRPLLDFHAVARAGVTLVVKKMPAGHAAVYDAVELGRGNVVTAYGDAAPCRGASHVSIGLYVFDRPFLVDKLRRMKSGGTDLANELIVPAVGEGAATAYGYDGYWARIDTVDDYYAVTFECLTDDPPCALDDPRWPIYTRLPDDPPVKLGPKAVVHNSLVADGSIINGRVENSVLFRRVYVEDGAQVRDSVVMDGARLEAGAAVDRAILDKRVCVGRGACVGADVGEPRPNENYPEKLNQGITLVAKGINIPARFTIGRNCLVDVGVHETAFEHLPGRALPNGTSAGVVG